MIIVDTAYHVTFDENTSNPTKACVGKCRKVWWPSNFMGRSKDFCPLCGGALCDAVEKVHYTVISQANRPLRLGDFTSAVAVPHSEKKKLKNFLSNGARIDNLSLVKPAFEEKARAEWFNPTFDS